MYFQIIKNLIYFCFKRSILTMGESIVDVSGTRVGTLFWGEKKKKT